MTATIGLERLPGAVEALLREATANLLAIANDLDALVAHGPTATLTAIELREGEGDRITHALLDVARTSHRAGPDRGWIVELFQAIDDVVDAVNDLAWTWSRRPIPPLADLVLSVRDAVRTVSRTARTVESDRGLAESLERSGETTRAARAECRSARRWLLVDQGDAELAIAGQAVITTAEESIRACQRLRASIERHAVS